MATEFIVEVVDQAVKNAFGGRWSSLDMDVLKWVIHSLHTELEANPSLNSDELVSSLGLFLGESGLDIENMGEGYEIATILQSVLSSLEPYLEPLIQNSTLERLDEEVVIMDQMKEAKFEDPFLGIKLGGGINFNVSTPMDELLNERKERLKERERNVRNMKEWERSKEPWPSPVKIHGSDVQKAALTDVVLNRFLVAVGGRPLLQDADLKICLGRKYGLIGRNGIGKSTLLKALVTKSIPGMDKSLNIACLEQEVEWPDGQSCMDAVLSVDKERILLMKEAAEIENAVPGEISGERIALVYNRLTEIEVDEAPKLAKEVLLGLGLSEAQLTSPVKSLSGGWRMRVALARALFSEPNILLLDEPTNHLDLHAVAWLTKYINNSPSTYILVSHARDFLNEICTDIIEFKKMKLTYFKGDFDVYERVVEERELQDKRAYESQQARIQHDQKFIDRFRAKASKAASVQSRIKQLAKLPKMDAITNDPNLVFKFLEPEKPTGGKSSFNIKDASVSYPSDPNKTILENIDFNVDMESRIAVCGPNGSGKTTLLKLLTQELKATRGEVEVPMNLRVGYFSQHHVDSLDLSLSAASSMIMRFSTAAHEITMNEARSYLGKFGVTGSLALEPLFILSGGQKSRVALALCAYNNPHVLILDEPTNHFDIEAVQALIAALNDFEGGVIIVSHDAFLLSCVVDDVYHVEPSNKSVVKFKGSFNLYKKLLLQAGPRGNPVELLKDKAMVAKAQGKS